MNNILIPYPNKENFLFFLHHNIDGFLLGIDGYSENFNYYVKSNNLEKAILKIRNNNKKVYIMINKMFFNKDIPKLKRLLDKLNKLDIDGVIFSDMSVFNIVKENKLDINLIYHSKMITNSKTINFLSKRGLYGYIPTPQITIDEIIKIYNQTNCKSIVKLLGYTNMATSSRTLISNYFKYIKSDKDSSKKYYMYDEITKEYYPIKEDGYTNFFSSKILNGILEYKKLIDNNVKSDIFLDDYMIDKNSFYNIIEAFTALRNCPDDEEFSLKLKKVIDSNLFNNTDNGFLNKKTIVKVKKSE